MSTVDKDDDAMLAAEYALGLLRKDEAQDTHQRALEDAAFARLVTEWEIRFAGLAEDLPDEVPSVAARNAVMAELFPETVKPGWRQRLWPWQAISAVSAAVVVALLAGELLWQGEGGGPLYTAEIASDIGDFRVVAVVDKTTNEVILTRTVGAAPAGRILQVWAHGEGAPAISVGLWPDGESVRLPMPPTISAVEGILTLGVSEEPPGGSPTGSPSGRVFGTVDIPGVRHDS